MLSFDKPTAQCDTETEMCYRSAVIIDLLSATSFVFNIIHIITLKSVLSLKGKSYFSILIAMSVVDMWVSASTIVTNNCEIRQLIKDTMPLPTLCNMIICVLMESGYCWRYIIQCLSATERYIAVCRPFAHRSSSLIANIGKFFTFVAVLVFIIITCKSIGLVNLDVFCVHSVWGPLSLWHMPSGAVSCVLMAVPTGLIAFLLPITWREIQHLQRTAPQQIAATKFAVKYVMIINIMFVSLMAPSLLLFIISMGFWSQGLHPPEIFMWIVTYSHTLYGLVKSLIYAFMSSVYRQTFVKVFVPKLCQRKRITAVAVEAPQSGATP